MASADKEKILVELRNYHTTAFPEVLSSAAMSALREKFMILEDGIIAMILGLVNGKVEFSGFGPQLSAFKENVDSLKKINASEKKRFLQKIQQLTDILAMAENTNFKLRPIRFRKPVVKK